MVHGQPGRARSERQITMPRREEEERETADRSKGQLQGLPVIRRNVAGIDLGSERHWVCAPTLEGSGREVTSFGATTGGSWQELTKCRSRNRFHINPTQIFGLMRQSEPTQNRVARRRPESAAERFVAQKHSNGQDQFSLVVRSYEKPI